MLWFAVFGGAGIYIELYGGGGLADVVFEDVSKALFFFFEYFPGTPVLNTLAVALVFIFLVTSADSGTFVLAMMTSDGRSEARRVGKAWVSTCRSRRSPYQ